MFNHKMTWDEAILEAKKQLFEAGMEEPLLPKPKVLYRTTLRDKDYFTTVFYTATEADADVVYPLICHWDGKKETKFTRTVERVDVVPTYQPSAYYAAFEAKMKEYSVILAQWEDKCRNHERCEKVMLLCSDTAKIDQFFGGDKVRKDWEEVENENKLHVS